MLKTLFIEAVGAILANKSRTLLTLLGIIIGIASVITVLAAGEGGKQIILKEFEGLSPTSLIIIPNWQDQSLNSAFTIEAMTPKDLDDLETYGTKIEAIAPMDSRRTLIRAGKVEKQLTVTGTNSNYIEYVEYEIEAGRIITDSEERSRSKVAIIGSNIRDQFFPGEKAVGNYVTAFGTPIKVIGVLAPMEKSETISLSNPDEQYNNAVVVPISIFRRLFGGNGNYHQLMCKAVSMDEIAPAKQEILRILARNHGKWDNRVDKFMIVGMQEQLDMINSVVGTVTIGVAVLAGIALLVAAIGIMNIMLVSVKERTREIGIRKAIGAKNWHIQMQFLIETLILCGGGGFAGLGLAVLAANLIGHFAHWPAVVKPGIAAFSILLSLVTGLLSGFYPAIRASKLVPQEALRYE